MGLLAGAACMDTGGLRATAAGAEIAAPGRWGTAFTLIQTRAEVMTAG